MTNRTIKSAIQKILNSFGYQICRKELLPNDAFGVQRELIQVQAPVILDIGAYVGQVTAEYRRLFPLASIHCFEPFHESFQILLKNVEGDSRTFCHNIALSNQKGSAVLNVNLSSSTNSLLPSDRNASSFWGEGVLDTTSQIKVDTTTVDIFCQESSISHIDILKMDVQGAEYSVLSGAKEMLSNHNISLIYTELILCPTYKGQCQLHEYLSLFDSFDYNLLDFFNPVRRNNRLIHTDAIFVCSY